STRLRAAPVAGTPWSLVRVAAGRGTSWPSRALRTVRQSSGTSLPRRPLPGSAPPGRPRSRSARCGSLRGTPSSWRASSPQYGILARRSHRHRQVVSRHDAASALATRGGAYPRPHGESAIRLSAPGEGIDVVLGPLRSSVLFLLPEGLDRALRERDSVRVPHGRTRRRASGGPGHSARGAA